jgi:hypothetical protein
LRRSQRWKLGSPSTPAGTFTQARVTTVVVLLLGAAPMTVLPEGVTTVAVCADGVTTVVVPPPAPGVTVAPVPELTAAPLDDVTGPVCVEAEPLTLAPALPLVCASTGVAATIAAISVASVHPALTVFMKLS